VFCMKLSKLFIVLVFLLFSKNSFATEPRQHAAADSVYLFSYGTDGLRFAWSDDRNNWTPVGTGQVYLRSDFGRWGSDKKMFAPYVILGRGGVWQCVWSLNDRVRQFAHAQTKNLIDWGPQGYPFFEKGKNILRPVISYHKDLDIYQIVYTDSEGAYFQTETKDFKTYSPAKEVPRSAYKSNTITTTIQNNPVSGQLHRVKWAVVEELNKTAELRNFKAQQDAETTKEDPVRFANLTKPELHISAEPEKAKAISKLLTGIFFEDINYSADGGLYGELIQNRDFEYQPSDKENHDTKWNSNHSWTFKGKEGDFTIRTEQPLHPNNPHYAALNLTVDGSSLSNSGYDGIAIKKGENYLFSTFVRVAEGKKLFEVRIVSEKYGLLSKGLISCSSKSWKEIKTTLKSSVSASDVSLQLWPLQKGRIDLDMISLFPQNTFKNRRNGLREDLADTIAAIKPRFVRFPGGCVAHGDGIHNIYRWKNTIGALQARVPDRNLWGYHQSMGLGYFEYLQFCEDIGAAPVPVIAAGVPCQNSGANGGGQQGGIPMADMPAYIQDIIDLVEYCNGATNTKWGKERAAAGHPKPFNLKYIGIGNEDQITDVFRERFAMIYKALKKAHPEITIIGTAGPFFEGTDYEEGWALANELKVDMIDEHYYRPPGWFINNQDFYDKYDRSKSKVYLGEYAASLPGGNRTNLETALSEALYLTSLERNGDVVSMASYAPLLAKEKHTQWNPDLIYFNNTEIKPTIGYYVQQLYGQNVGDEFIPAQVDFSVKREDVIKRVAYSITRDKKSGKLFIKIVNMLPVAVKTNIDLSKLSSVNKQVIKKELSGLPGDYKIQPIKTAMDFSNLKSFELKPYSFTVFEL
jgi:alpha-L-arabinofuranosidase